MAALGWVAAAASLVLAVSLWVINGSGPQGDEATSAVIRTTRTWTPEAPLALGPPAHLVPLVDAPRATSEPKAAPSPPPAPATVTVDESTPISRENAETLDSATMLLAMLQQADDQSFAEVDFVRRTTEYDDLLPRLAAARRELPAAEQSALLAAESVLYRVVAGPLSLDEVRELRHTIDRLDLPGQIHAMRSRRPATSSL